MTKQELARIDYADLEMQRDDLRRHIERLQEDIDKIDRELFKRRIKTPEKSGD